MPDTYIGSLRNIAEPAYYSAAVSPSDSADLATIARWLYVGVAGDVTMALENDAAAVLFKAMPVGLYEIRVRRVMATGTSASNLVALW